ncbi:MAG: pyridoxal-phosphate dependent enzyme [Clostridia bacterium]|nr:pyridoxal-phosphate dependent enzyme [Clostridia bacterium]
MITVSEIFKAKKRIEQYIYKTPLDHAPFLSSSTRQVFLKLENQQLLKNVKVRGAFNKMSLLTKTEREKGIIVASTGNLGASLSYAACKLGIEKVKAIVPVKTSETKIKKMKLYGAKVMQYGENYDETYKMAVTNRLKSDAHLIDADADIELIAGYGTIGLEIFEENPSIEMVLVPIGGGGLITGIGLAMKALNPKVKIIGIQTEVCPAMKRSIDENICYSEYPSGPSVCEALIGGIGKIPFEMAPHCIDDVIVVKEETIMQATSLLLSEEKIVAEPSSAVGVAALMEQPEYFDGYNIAVVISGGNLDKRIIKQLLIDY